MDAEEEPSFTSSGEFGGMKQAAAPKTAAAKAVDDDEMF
jgi:hypothetical protein